VLEGLAPQVGLEPTTLRLTARHLHFSGLLIIAIYCLLSATCGSFSSPQNCGDYPQLPTILKESPHKIPHTENKVVFSNFNSEVRQPTCRLRNPECNGDRKSKRGAIIPEWQSKQPSNLKKRWPFELRLKSSVV
jgi:hypothetical protein